MDKESEVRVGLMVILGVAGVGIWSSVSRGLEKLERSFSKFVDSHQSEIFWFAILLAVVVYVFITSRNLWRDQLEFRKTAQRLHDENLKEQADTLHRLKQEIFGDVWDLQKKLALALKAPEANPQLESNITAATTNITKEPAPAMDISSPL